MSENKAIAIVGIGAVMPDAPNATFFWDNIKKNVSSIREVPPDRWSVQLYYDPDPSVPDKTYSKIGAFIRDMVFDPKALGIAIPPRVLAAMDEAQKTAILACAQALEDYGMPKRSLDSSRTAVILGNSMGGDSHYRTNLRSNLYGFLDRLEKSTTFQTLPDEIKKQVLQEVTHITRNEIPAITEDTMPGELANVIAGRISNIYNLTGANFIVDAACASSLAALQTVIDGLLEYRYDSALTGGVDRGMGPEVYIKFSKIGALSPDGSRPFAEGANGFVMGEGAALFLLKRLLDAERDGDKIYAVIRGIGSSSDGKGKGITAPNPAGQVRAIQRAWHDAGLSPVTAGYIEAHGTSTAVGDVAEVQALSMVFENLGLPVGKIALGSVKSTIGHLKSAAGAAGLFRAVMALYHKILPPTANFHKPNPNINFSSTPLYVNTEARPWEVKRGEVRRAGVSSFGFGGTNFHVVLEEYIPGMLTAPIRTFSVASIPQPIPSISIAIAEPQQMPSTPPSSPFYRGLLFLNAQNNAELRVKLIETLEGARSGKIPTQGIPNADDLSFPVRLAIEYEGQEELIRRLERALKGLEGDSPSIWQSLTAHGIYHGHGKPGKIAFLFPGQGSQYPNMMKDLCEVEPIAAGTFREADAVMEPILGKPLTSYIFVPEDEQSIAEAEKALKNTTITQPAVLTANVTILRLLEKFGVKPDLVLGHSLGEYAALVAAGVLTFPEALEVVSNRGREMVKASYEDNGCMAAVSGPLEKVEEVIKDFNGDVVIANINSPIQSVIGGKTAAVDRALEIFAEVGLQAVKIPVSHAFHTQIVEPASRPLREVIRRMHLKPPRLPVIANVTGEIYPSDPQQIEDLLVAQVYSPVQMVKSMAKLYESGARIFVESGPKRVLTALATDNLKPYNDVTILATNHPRKGSKTSFNEALAGLYAAGVGANVKTGIKAETPVIHLKTTPTSPSTAQKTGAPSGNREVEEFLLDLVSEKTGYERSMLDENLDLEADLGIDTVKQAELFLIMREHFNIPRPENLRLSDYNTLAKVKRFVLDALPASQAPAAEETKTSPVTKDAPLAQTSEIHDFLLSLVVEKTGYSRDALEMDLDLEADLGIDTVKQAEMLVAIRNRYSIPRPENMRLSDYNTLAKVEQFILQNLPKPENTQPALSDVKPMKIETKDIEVSTTPQQQDTSPSVIRRRLPVPMLLPKIDHCLPTKIEFTPESLILIIDDGKKTGKALASILQKKKVRVLLASVSSTLIEEVQNWKKDERITGIYFLPGLDTAPAIKTCTQEEWDSALQSRLYALFDLLKSLDHQPFLICATRMDGELGFSSEGLLDPLGGLISGFTKALSREREGILNKVIDFPKNASTQQIAQTLVEETLFDSHSREVGRKGSLRTGICLVESPLPEEKALELDSSTVYLVTGGSGGITASVVTDLANRFGGFFYLAGRTPAPMPGNLELERYRKDREGFKKEIEQKAQSTKNTASKNEREQFIQTLQKSADILDLISAVESGGGKAFYFSCDVSDRKSVDSLVKTILKEQGKIDIVIHAAGVEISRKLERKTAEEFHQVVTPKVNGIFHIYQALVHAEKLPAAMLFFSSIAGRMGNVGQTAYAAANDFLSKLALYLNNQHPHMHVTSIDWSAWAEVGMASRGRLPELMKWAGIDMLPPREAAPWVGREITFNPGGEVILTGSLGILEKDQQLQLSLAQDQVNVSIEKAPFHVLVQRCLGADIQSGFKFEAEVNPEKEPFLRDHTLNRIPIFPGVMGIEGFSAIALQISALCGIPKDADSFTFEDIRFLAPLKFYRGQPRRLTWKGKLLNHKDKLVVHLTLESDWELKSKGMDHLLHFESKLLLSETSTSLSPVISAPQLNNVRLEAEDIYRLLPHGPAFQVLAGVHRWGEDRLVGIYNVSVPRLVDKPQALFTHPALNELCLQTAGIWDLARLGKAALPSQIKKLGIYNPGSVQSPLYAVALPREEYGNWVYDIEVLDQSGRLWVQMKGYQSGSLPYPPQDDLLAPIRTWFNTKLD